MLQPAHARSSSSEMLAVGPPLSITTTAAVAPPLPPSPLAVATPFFHDLATPGSPTTTTPSLRSLLPPSRAREGRGGNHSMDVPQGDQPPVPPIKEGPPYRPGHWNQSTHRSLYIKNRYGRYLEMWPNGATQSVPESNSFCVFVMMSHIWHVVLKGFISDRYLCMNNISYQLYTRTDLHSDCYMKEAERNGSGHRVYSFAQCQTPDGKKCYLGMFRNGTMRLGREARQSQTTAQWLPIPVAQQEKNRAQDLKDRIHKQGGWDPPSRPPALVTPRPVSAREQRRKRVRRWCRNLDVIVRRPRKFVQRCKRDCDVLKKMIDSPDRYMRRCLLNHVRRRHRKKGPGGGGGGGGRGQGDLGAAGKEKVRARVQSLWPKRAEVLRRLRLLHRCNKLLRRRNGFQGRSCTKGQLRKLQKNRASKRRKAKASSSSSSSSSPSSSSSTPSSQSQSRSRRPRPSSRPVRRRIRHQRKRVGGEGRRRRKRREGEKGGGDAAGTVQPAVQRQKRRSQHRGSLWTALTVRL